MHRDCGTPCYGAAVLAAGAGSGSGTRNGVEVEAGSGP
jgi:hypothetical protein